MLMQRNDNSAKYLMWLRLAVAAVVAVVVIAVVAARGHA